MNWVLFGNSSSRLLSWNTVLNKAGQRIITLESETKYLWESKWSSMPNLPEYLRLFLGLWYNFKDEFWTGQCSYRVWCTGHWCPGYCDYFRTASKEELFDVFNAYQNILITLQGE